MTKTVLDLDAKAAIIDAASAAIATASKANDVDEVRRLTDALRVDLGLGADVTAKPLGDAYRCLTTDRHLGFLQTKKGDIVFAVPSVTATDPWITMFHFREPVLPYCSTQATFGYEPAA